MDIIISFETYLDFDVRTSCRINCRLKHGDPKQFLSKLGVCQMGLDDVPLLNFHYCNFFSCNNFGQLWLYTSLFGDYFCTRRLFAITLIKNQPESWTNVRSIRWQNGLWWYEMMQQVIPPHSHKAVIFLLTHEPSPQLWQVKSERREICIRLIFFWTKKNSRLTRRSWVKLYYVPMRTDGWRIQGGVTDANKFSGNNRDDDDGLVIGLDWTGEMTLNWT